MEYTSLVVGEGFDFNRSRIRQLVSHLPDDFFSDQFSRDEALTPVRNLILREEMRPHVNRLGEIEMAPARLGEQLRSVIDASLLKAHTGFRPEVSIAEGLGQTASFFREQQGNT